MGKIADISKWQGDVDWSKASQELDFCILRASCGETEDAKYSDNVNGCVKYNVPFGAYHYVKAGTATAAIKEAKLFFEVCQRTKREPAFYIADIEYEAQTDTTTEPVCVAFLNTMRGLGCHKIGLYINTRYKWAGAAIALCDIMWIPHWGLNDGGIPADKYKPQYPHDLWQYTSKGTLAGVKGNVDLNMLTGTKPMSDFIFANIAEEGSDENMAVKVGSARIDENNAAHGGNAGDQTGKEVSTQNWYLHSKGWVVLRAKEALAREKIAQCMERACANNHIGYDQHQRDTLYNEAKIYDFDVSKVEKDVECDCSALVRVCVNFAGISAGNFRTTNEASVLMATGAFEKFTDDTHCKKSANLLRGDILVSKTQGHTVVVLSDGANADEERGSSTPISLGDRTLSKGDNGSDVKALQESLILLGFSLPKYGADGVFGGETMNAVKAFQESANLDANGVFDEKSYEALIWALTALDADEPSQTPTTDTSMDTCVLMIKGYRASLTAIKRQYGGTLLEEINE